MLAVSLVSDFYDSSDWLVVLGLESSTDLVAFLPILGDGVSVF